MSHNPAIVMLPINWEVLQLALEMYFGLHVVGMTHPKAISGFPSKRTNLSPFTKDFRGGGHSNEYIDISYGHFLGGLS